MKISKRLFQFLILLALGCSGSVALQAQDKKLAPPTPAATEKAEEIIKRAIEVLGGSAYLNVQNVVGRGFYTAYQDGDITIADQVSRLHSLSRQGTDGIFQLRNTRGANQHGRDRLAL